MFGKKKLPWFQDGIIPDAMIDNITDDSWLGCPPSPIPDGIKWLGNY